MHRDDSIGSTSGMSEVSVQGAGIDLSDRPLCVRVCVLVVQMQFFPATFFLFFFSTNITRQ